MPHRRHVLLTLSAAAAGPALTLPRLARAQDDALQQAVAGAHRSAANAARDAWRHPLQTLRFFDVQPTHTVVELSPGGGWYTEILAPYLRARGRLILAADDPASASEYRRRGAARLQQKLQAEPALYDKVEVLPFEPPRLLQLAAPGSVDRVLTFRNVHNWAAAGEDVVAAVFASVRDCLRPGGVFGVVDHRLPAARPQDAKASSGYLHTDYVVRLAEGAGLRLQAASEINANPKDGADHRRGVWALPPTFADKDVDRERYAAIGESDRMTLKFTR